MHPVFLAVVLAILVPVLILIIVLIPAVVLVVILILVIILGLILILVIHFRFLRIDSLRLCRYAILSLFSRFILSFEKNTG